MSRNENMTPNDRNPCTFNFRHFAVLHFPALHFCPSFSRLAFSAPPVGITQTAITTRYFTVTADYTDSIKAVVRETVAEYEVTVGQLHAMIRPLDVRLQSYFTHTLTIVSTQLY